MPKITVKISTPASAPSPSTRDLPRASAQRDPVRLTVPDRGATEGRTCPVQPASSDGPALTRELSVPPLGEESRAGPTESRLRVTAASAGSVVDSGEASKWFAAQDCTG